MNKLLSLFQYKINGHFVENNQANKILLTCCEKKIILMLTIKTFTTLLGAQTVINIIITSFNLCTLLFQLKSWQNKYSNCFHNYMYYLIKYSNYFTIFINFFNKYLNYLYRMSTIF